MALQWMDNFQQYGTAARMTDGVYADATGCSIVADPDPLATGNVVKISAGSFTNGLFRKVLSTAVTVIGTMQRLWLPTLPDLAAHQPFILIMRNAGNSDICGIRIRTDGYLEVVTTTGAALSGTVGNIVATTSRPVIVANAWQHVEIKLTLDAAAGAAEIRVGGISVLNAINLNTLGSGAGPCTQIITEAVTSGSSTYSFYLKDYAIWDTTGAHNTSFLGTCFVYSMRPDSDVSGAWSIFGGAGSAWASINESNPDDDTKYIYSGWPAAAAQVCGITDLPIDATIVLGMMALVRSRKSDGGDGNLQVGLISAGTTGTGADRPITTAYTYWSDIFETDPHTAAPWSVPAANAATFQLNRTL